MKKLFLIATIVTIITSCTHTQSERRPLCFPNVRFEEVYRQDSFWAKIVILRDKETNKEYLFIVDGYGAGITNL